MGFYERFISLCSLKKVAPSAVAAKAGFDKSIVSYWKKNSDATPKFDTLIKIAEVLDVSWVDLAGEKLIEYLSGRKESVKIKKAVDALSATQVLLRTLYNSIEEKEITGLYGCTYYYLVGEGKDQFVLYEDDIEFIKDMALSIMPAMVERLKDTRPESAIIEECEADCNTPVDNPPK